MEKILTMDEIDALGTSHTKNMADAEDRAKQIAKGKASKKKSKAKMPKPIVPKAKIGLAEAYAAEEARRARFSGTNTVSGE